MRAAKLCALIATLSLAGPAHADFLEVRRGVTFKEQPDRDAEIRRRLQPGQRIYVLDQGLQRNGYYHALALDGEEGWVYRTFVRRHLGDIPGGPALDTVLGLSRFGSWAVHFLDVGTGDATIIDMGDREIVIDGGDSIRVLNAYQEQTGVIQDPIELVVVTHGDTDHWNGLRRLLGFDGVVDDPLSVLEYWDPGYDRDCNSASDSGRRNYLRFVDDMVDLVGTANALRPLGDELVPATASGTPAAFTSDAFPEATLTLLHSDDRPTEGGCSYRINDSSIVLMLELEGIRFLLTGDANGKRRSEASPGTPDHVEEALLALEASHPGMLAADVLKVPHHGSETASTQAFIDAVDPEFAVISASTRHHLPRESVVERYDDGQREILRTDVNRTNDNDHIICAVFDGELRCNFADALVD